MKWGYLGLGLLLFVLSPLLADAGPLAQATAPVSIEQWLQTTAADFSPGTFEGTIVTTSGDGEVRLAEGRRQGTYLSAVHEMSFPCRALGLLYRAQVTATAALAVEVRQQRADGEWGPWTVLPGGPWRDAQGRAAGKFLLAYPDPGRRLQYRLTLVGSGAFPVLEEIALVCLSAGDVPAARAVPPWQEGDGRPYPLSPSRWGGEVVAGTVVTPTTAPVCVEIGPATISVGADIPRGPALRMLQQFHRQVLGGDDLPYSFLVDAQGCIYQGRQYAAGPVIRIGILGTVPGEVASPTVEDALVALLDWWSTATEGPGGDYDLATPDDPFLAERLAARLRAGNLRRSEWLLAHGVTGAETDTWFLIMNPATVSARATLEVRRSAGQTVRRTLVVPAESRSSLLIDQLVARDTFWARVWPAGSLVVERAIYYGHDGDDSPALEGLSREWYLPGGMQTPGFTTTYALLNPGPTAVTATVTVFGQAGVAGESQFVLSAGSCLNLPVRQVYSASTPLGGRVLASAPIAVEQAVRFAGAAGGYGMPGSPYLSRRWTFAGIETAEPFVTELALLNPYSVSVPITVTLMSEDGTTLRRSYTLLAGEQVLNLNQILPRLALAADLWAGRPIAAARVTYFGGLSAAHASLGAPRTARTWLLPEGATAEPFETFLLVANPNDLPTSIEVGLLGVRGELEQLRFFMPAHARLTVPLDDYQANVADVSAMVQSERPVVVERTMYLHERQGGHASLGIAR